METVSLLKGNEAIAHAAIRCGADGYFGYPITPQSEILETLEAEKPWETTGMVVLQAESEVAAINMVYGAAGAGVRAMTSSSSPGIALKQEGISYMCGSELPGVILNVMRAGPGLGGIQPSQADYFQATRGGGNGDYRTLVYAPANLQEAVDLITEAFDAADYYRNPVMVLADGMIGQMMEPVEFSDEPSFKGRDLKEKTWATTGTKGKRERVLINSLYLDPQMLEDHNRRLEKKYLEMTAKEPRSESYNLDDAEIIVVAYGTVSRIVKNVIEDLAAEGIKVGLIRPITLWPFPEKAFESYPETAKAILTVEMSAGQMIDDVKICNQGRLPVHFYGRVGGMIPNPGDIAAEIKKILGRCD
jgi:2-oxoglutarate ferredoxin oxidoreductase subunit alpha